MRPRVPAIEARLATESRAPADPAQPNAVRRLRPAIPTPATSQNYDPWVLFLVGSLMTLGVAMVYSASVRIDGEPFDIHRIWSSPLRHGIFVALAFVGMVVAAQIDYRLCAWERKGEYWVPTLLLVVTVGLLAAALVPGIGVEQKGAFRAISLPGGMSFQPSELAKLSLCIWLAAFLTRPGGEPRSLRRGFLPACIVGAIVIALVGKEDFGTAGLMGIVMVSMLLVGGSRWLHLGAVFLLGVAGAAFLVLDPEKRYRLERLYTWASASADPKGDAYQVTQSLYAIASGGWFGRGLGASIRKYDYLPQRNNDFIFSIVCEELGVIGGLFVVFLFLCLLLRGWYVASRALTPFGRLLAIGITLTFCVQAAMNIAVVTNFVPTKGISLPFVSEGGSGVLFLGLAAGVLAAVGRTARPNELTA